MTWTQLFDAHWTNTLYAIIVVVFLRGVFAGIIIGRASNRSNR